MEENCRTQFLKGIELFNQEQFYDCHDVIEEIWLGESSDKRPFLQGIIQAAAAFHHYQHGKRGAARSLFSLAVQKLKPYPAVYCGVRVKVFVGKLEDWKKALDENISLKSYTPLSIPYPKIEIPC